MSFKRRVIRHAGQRLHAFLAKICRYLDECANDACAEITVEGLQLVCLDKRSRSSSEKLPGISYDLS